MTKLFSVIYSASQSIKIVNKWINLFIQYFQQRELEKINHKYDQHEAEMMALYDAIELARIKKDVKKMRIYRSKLASLSLL